MPAVALAARPDASALAPRSSSARVAELAAKADAPNTRRALAADWAAWVRWCEAEGESPALPVSPEQFARYVAAEVDAGRAIATVRRRVATMARLHREADLASPSEHAGVRAVVRGAAREAAEAGATPRRARALSVSMVAAALPELELRDRAVVLVGVVSGLRGSELAGLRWGQLRQTGAGYQIALGASKTDATGRGALVGVPRGRGLTCPVAALRDLAAQRFGEGERRDPAASVFGVSAKTITRIVKRVAELAGEDPADFSSHSLRAGLVTSAAEEGVSLGAIMEQSRHRSAEVAATYTRSAEADRNPAARAVVGALARAEDAA